MGMSKAHKLLGEMPVAHDLSNREERSHGSNQRRTFMTAAADKTSQKKDRRRELVPAAASDGNVPSQHLHVRASSPLLGQTYQNHERGAPPVPKQTHVRPSGSSSALHSYFSSRKSVTESQSSLASTLNHQHVDTRSISSQTRDPVEPAGLSHKASRASMKEPKRKMRPPRIDLSLLFPKPKTTETQLLSPQRLTNSPSPISVVSEYPTITYKTSESQLTGRRLTKRSPQTRAPSTRKREQLPVNPVVMEKPRSQRPNNLDWFDVEFERTVGCSEIDVALSRFESEQKAPDLRRRVSPSRSAPHLHRLEDVPETPPSLSDGTTQGVRTSVSTIKTANTHLDPNAFRAHHRGRSNSAEAWQSNGHGQPLSGRRPISKVSSRATLRNYDLNTSSVLCLSSSEDEADEEDDHESVERQRDSSSVPSGSRLRDSVGTFDDFEPEICTAEAAQATRAAPTLRRLERPASTVNLPSFAAPKQHAVRRIPSMTSAEKSSTYTVDGQNRSRRSSGIPTISEPEMTPTERPPPTHSLSPSALEAHRRSRIIAVTKQEQHLLEAMRQRQGKITPSLFQETQCGSSDTEQPSVLSASLRDRDSLYASDMSFLRLSAAFPPRVGHTVRHGGDQDGSSSQGAASDGEQRTINSAVSPRTSLIYTDSVSSPGMSPMTPTLPMQRFSRQSQHPPPRRPPPAVPQESQPQPMHSQHNQRQQQHQHQHQHPQPQQPQLQDQRRFSRQSRNSRHSRRRTDSSEAIVLDEPEDVKDHDEFPPWVYEWAAGDQHAPVATVH